MDSSAAQPVQHLRAEGIADRSADFFEVDADELQQVRVASRQFVGEGGQLGREDFGVGQQRPDGRREEIAVLDDCEKQVFGAQKLSPSLRAFSNAVLTTVMVFGSQ